MILLEWDWPWNVDVVGSDSYLARKFWDCAFQDHDTYYEYMTVASFGIYSLPADINFASNLEGSYV